MASRRGGPEEHAYGWHNHVRSMLCTGDIDHVHSIPSPCVTLVPLRRLQDGKLRRALCMTSHNTANWHAYLALRSNSLPWKRDVIFDMSVVIVQHRNNGDYYHHGYSDHCSYSDSLLWCRCYTSTKHILQHLQPQQWTLLAGSLASSKTISHFSLYQHLYHRITVDTKLETKQAVRIRCRERSIGNH